MTISSQSRKTTPFAGNGTMTALPFAFKVFAADEIDVIRTVTATGVSTTLTLGVDFSVTLNGNQDTSPGGTVTLVTPLVAGSTAIVASKILATQPVALQNAGGFFPGVINGAFDRAIALIQQLYERQARTPALPVTSNETWPDLPAAAARVNSVLGFDGAGVPAVMPKSQFQGVQGPQGERGPQGPEGPQGIQGIQGPPGSGGGGAGDDPTKLPLAGGTLTGSLNLSSGTALQLALRKASDVLVGRLRRSGDNVILSADVVTGELIVETNGATRTRWKPSGSTVLPKLAGDPSGGEAGEAYYNTTTNRVRWHNGTAWQNLAADSVGGTLDPLTLSAVTASAITSSSMTLSVQITGNIPTGAKALLQITANPTGGPWLESNRPTAVAGVFSYNFTGLAAGTTLYGRAFVFTDNGGVGDVIHAQTANSTFATAATTVTEQVLAVGDSLTNGSLPGDPTPYYSWRGAFQTLMTGAGLPFDMIGPQTSGLGGGSDPQHAAWGGASLDAVGDPGNNIDDRLPTIFTVGVQPTLIVLYLGWNEMWDAGDRATAVARYNALFQKIRNLRPNARFVLCTLHVPNDGSRRTEQVDLNNAIKAIAAANPTVVKVADLDAMALVAGDYADYVHFSTQGAAKIAQTIFTAATGAQATPSTAVDKMLADMQATTVSLNNLPTNRDTFNGGRVISGGDMRAGAQPIWWLSSLSSAARYQPPGWTTYALWQTLLPWHVVWDLTGHVGGLNVVCELTALKLYWVGDGMTAWALLATENAPLGSNYGRGDGAAPHLGPASTGTTSGDGTALIKVDPTGGTYHGWGAQVSNGTNGFDPSKVIGLHARMKFRKRLENLAGADQRSSARYGVQLGIDAYPYAGAPNPAYWPGAQSSRFLEATNEWQDISVTNVVPCFNRDGVPAIGGAYNARQAITEAYLRSLPPPPF